MENADLWSDVFSQNLSDVFRRPVDLNSRHLIRDDPLKMDRSLTADFLCKGRMPRGGGICGRKWDSTSVTLTFLYKLNLPQNRGEIHIKEYGQKCQRCRTPTFAKPSFDYESANKAAAKLKQKILEKFYGEVTPDQPATMHGRRERKKPHDSANCEACLKGVCVATEGRGDMFMGGMRQRGRQESMVIAGGPRIGQWGITLNGSREIIMIGEETDLSGIMAQMLNIF